MVWPKLEALVEKGYTKSIGLSNFSVQMILDLLTYCKIKPVMNQVELHPYLKQSELVRFLKDFDILPVAFCPLAKPVAKTETRDPRDGVCPDLREAENIKKIAEKYKKSNL